MATAAAELGRGATDEAARGRARRLIEAEAALIRRVLERWGLD